jgi:hypothetical protein
VARGGRGHRSAMGVMQKILGAGDPATGRRTQGDPRMKGAGRGRTTRATRGKVPPGSARFGMNKNKTKATTKAKAKPKPKAKTTGRGRGAPAPRGLGRLLHSLTGKR